jgi:hypothetical protein
MQRIIKANIERFKLRLAVETNEAQRAMLMRLLAEEEAKLTKADKEKAY